MTYELFRATDPRTLDLKRPTGMPKLGEDADVADVLLDVGGAGLVQVAANDGHAYCKTSASERGARQAAHGRQ